LNFHHAPAGDSHTIRKLFDALAQGTAKRLSTGKLEAFEATVAEWLEKDATVSGTVIEKRLRPLGYPGSPVGAARI
jgi:hypothetical protein